MYASVEMEENFLIGIWIAISLSLVGNATSFTTWYMFPDLRSTSQTFALWLAIGSTGYNICTILQQFIDQNGMLCNVIASIDNYFSLVSIFTTVIVAFYMKIIFLPSSTTITDRMKLKKWYYYFVFTLPVPICLLPFTTNSYGKNEGDIYCWLRTDSNNEEKNTIGFMWQMLSFYVPLIICILYIAFIYTKIFIWYKPLYKVKIHFT